MLAVRSPMVGTFYRRPKPDEPPFVEEGSRVEAGAALCIVEAMKLFNTVPAPVAGRVARIVAENGQVVQRDAVLIIIEPDARK
jgi:acetyl-CoA carboxylase biotin carboxyl carrier protein